MKSCMGGLVLGWGMVTGSSGQFLPGSASQGMGIGG